MQLNLHLQREGTDDELKYPKVLSASIQIFPLNPLNTASEINPYHLPWHPGTILSLPNTYQSVNSSSLQIKSTRHDALEEESMLLKAITEKNASEP